ncbi:hypothetical protein BN1221_04986 [Brenneria goodwinii]|uniref:Uncharacterized protein n=1 Tax=Brenneria goodwinii TaxID=1109412 RepID=A0A0G4K2V4_9GAMM|nr:hypothetical protein BN1221_04986 [Brenneria goodwinii]
MPYRARFPAAIPGKTQGIGLLIKLETLPLITPSRPPPCQGEEITPDLLPPVGRS